LHKIIYIVCQAKNTATYGGRKLCFIGRTVGVDCKQMMEFVSKIEKDKPYEIGLSFLKNDITNIFDL